MALRYPLDWDAGGLTGWRRFTWSQASAPNDSVLNFVWIASNRVLCSWMTPYLAVLAPFCRYSSRKQ